jgi:cytosine deaminase
MGHHPELVVRNGYVATEDAVVDVSIAGGRIGEVAPEIPATADTEIDAAGRLVSPGLIDAHVHTDMALAATGGRRPDYNQETYGREQLIERSHEYFSAQSADELRSRIRDAVELAVTNGVLHLRNHVYLDSEVGTKVLEATLDVRDELAHDARSPQWAIIESPDPRYVIKDGQVVARNEPRDVSVGTR